MKNNLAENHRNDTVNLLWLINANDKFGVEYNKLI